MDLGQLRVAVGDYPGGELCLNLHEINLYSSEKEQTYGELSVVGRKGAAEENAVSLELQFLGDSAVVELVGVFFAGGFKFEAGGGVDALL